MKPTSLRDVKAQETVSRAGHAQGQREAFKAGQRAAMQPAPQPKSHPVDPYTAAVLEAQDGDGDIERATRGRVGPGGASEDEVDVGPLPHQPQTTNAQSSNQSSGGGQNDETQNRASEALGHAEGVKPASTAGPVPNVSAGERHSQAMLETVSLDRHASASLILQTPYRITVEALAQPIMQRVERSSEMLNDLQMRATGVGG